MKFIKYYILGIVLVFGCGYIDAFAQAVWLPKTIYFNVPFADTYSQTSECPNEGVRDTSWESTGDLSWLGYIGGYGYSTSYQRTGNSITIQYIYSPGATNYCNGTNTISFLFDSINGKIRNFFMSYTGADYQNINGCISNSINISSLNFSMSDSLLIANDSNLSITGVTYTHGWWDVCKNDPGPHHGRWSKGYRFSHLLGGATSCSITLVIPQLSNSVPSNATNNIFSISTSVPNHTIHFSFPSSDHPHLLTIYDILGREIKRIEIPSGVSEYHLERDGFMSGYYFARLGNLNAKFVVN